MLWARELLQLAQARELAEQQERQRQAEQLQQARQRQAEQQREAATLKRKAQQAGNDMGRITRDIRARIADYQDKGGMTFREIDDFLKPFDLSISWLRKD